MKYLYANGDSWTHGDEIAEFSNNIDKCSIRYYNTWPWLLSQLKNIPVCVNDAQGGASNTRIFRRTNDFIFRWLASNKSPGDLFICIGWTTPERNEICNGDTIVSIRAQGHLKLNQIPTDDKSIDNYQKAFYETYSDNYGECQTARYMLNLRLLCAGLGIKYFDFIAIGNQPEFWNLKTQQQWGIKLENMYMEDSWNGVAHRNNWPLHQYRHPTKESQQLWAELLFKELS